MTFDIKIYDSDRVHSLKMVQSCTIVVGSVTVNGSNNAVGQWQCGGVAAILENEQSDKGMCMFTYAFFF